jgi:zinc transporter 1/2/3
MSLAAELMNHLLDTRSLTQHDDHGDDHDDDDDVFEGEGNTLNLRIIAIFVILLGGLIGGFPPIFTPLFRDPFGMASRVLRAFSAGVILALAFVHIIPESIEMMDGLVPDYHGIAGVVILGGLLSMVVVEHLTHTIVHNTAEASSLNPKDIATVSVPKIDNHDLDPAPTRDQHAPACPSKLDLIASRQENFRRQAVAYLFELGCIFHSAIIGISLGVITYDDSQLTALIIALVFHNLLEAMALGAFVTQANFSMVKKVFMVTLYCATVPIGVAVGIAISDTYDEGSLTARGVQGSLSAFSAGVLLHIALVQMIADDFSTRPDHGQVTTRKVMVYMYLALALGTAVMCVLGIWA